MGRKGQHVRGGIAKSGMGPDAIQHLFITNLGRSTTRQDLQARQTDPMHCLWRMLRPSLWATDCPRGGLRSKPGL
jgi:hypothetical protein